MRRSYRLPPVAALALLGLAIASCGGSGVPSSSAASTSAPATVAESSTSSASPQLVLSFDHVAPAGRLLQQPGSRTSLDLGGAAATMVVVTAGGGRARSVSDPDAGRALRLPPASSPGRAVLAVYPTGTTDALDPGAGRLRISARFDLDEVSTGRRDNGDNLLQRGLFGSSSQYKLQVDDGRVSCRVAGDDGSVLVTDRRPVARGTWHTATCVREGDSVELRVTSRAGRVRTTHARGPIGTLEFAADSPLAVGGKILPSGAVAVGDADQFNGALDDVAVRVG